MSYAICRIEKVSSSHDIAGIQIHDRRERTHSNSNPDIDFSRSHLNYSLCENANGSSFNAFIDKQITERYTGKKAIRKDAVRMVSVIFTSDNDFFSNLSLEQQREYFQSCYDWAAERWGANNIISSDVHMDEVTPHMHMNLVPLTPDGRLSAKECVGSGSKALQKLQDDFYNAVGKPYGLERGKRADLDNGEKPRRHQGMSEFKARTDYLQNKENSLKKEINAREATVQALQERLNGFNEILHAEPKNAVEGVPVPPMAKLAILSKEDKEKMLYPPEYIKEQQELARNVAVVAAANEQRSSELSLMAAELSDREQSAAEKERNAQIMLNEAEEKDKIAEMKLKQAGRELQDLQREPYIATLLNYIKEIETENNKLTGERNNEKKMCEKAQKALNEAVSAAEKEIAPLRTQNGELSERIRTLEDELKKQGQQLQELDKKKKKSDECFATAYECGEYICNRVGLDFDKIFDMRQDGYRLSYIVDEGRGMSR